MPTGIVKLIVPTPCKHRTVAFGYYVNEVPLPPRQPIKDDLRVVYKSERFERVYMQVSLGPVVDCAALPMADIRDVRNVVAAVEQRIGRRVPVASAIRIRQLRSFVRRWLRKNLKPLTEVGSVEEWLSETNYSEARKRELRNAAVAAIVDKHLHCKSFLKTETYDKYKFPRAINSRTDAFKVATGPFFHAVEKQLFKLPYFVKYVPVADRGNFIMSRLAKWKSYFCSDYTAFETHMVPEVIKTVEWQLYAYMATGLPGAASLRGLLLKALCGKNVCHFRGVKAEVEGTRMSGDMCTSLGNGFTNLMIVLFVCSLHHIPVDGVVEGDDGIFGTNSRVPLASYFEEMGFTIKIEGHQQLSESGFCQMYFDPETGANVVDPAKLLCKFGWSHSTMRYGGDRILRGLLRAKAFSLSCELPNCPIAASLARYAMRLAGAGPMIWDDGRKRNYWEAYLCQFPRPFGRVSMSSRLLVERLFGMPVCDQLAIEHYIDSLNSGELCSDLIRSYMHNTWVDYRMRYGARFRQGQACNF